MRVGIPVLRVTFGWKACDADWNPREGQSCVALLGVRCWSKKDRSRYSLSEKLFSSIEKDVKATFMLEEVYTDAVLYLLLRYPDFWIETPSVVCPVLL